MPHQYLWSLHNFRAFAIVNIVMLHLWMYPSKPEDGINNVEITREILFHGSTFYFIFISGFLFHWLSQRLDMRTYYIKKLKNVICPYIIISVCTWLLFYGLSQLNIYHYKAVDENIFLSLIRGSVAPHLWYIPFIAVVFLVSPFLLLIEEKIFIKFAPIILLLPLLGTRTGSEISLGQYLFYFPGYIMGMYVSIRYNTLIPILSKKRIYAFIVIIITSIMLATLYKMYPNRQNSNIMEGAFYIQKVAIMAILLVFFHNHMNQKNRVWDLIARMSFAIYFLHYVIGRLNQLFLFKIMENKAPEYLWGAITFFFPFIALFECMILIYLVKLVFGKRSRYLIGY